MKEKKVSKIGVFLWFILGDILGTYLFPFIPAMFVIIFVSGYATSDPTYGMFNNFFDYWIFIFIWAAFLLIIFNKFTFMKKDLKINKKQLICLGIFGALGLFENLFCFMIAKLTGNVTVSFNEFNFLYLALLFVYVFVQSSAEELMCRLFLIKGFIKAKMKPIIAIAINSAIFGAMHLANNGITFLSFLDIVLFGVIMSVILVKFDSFWGCAAFHFGWNYSQALILGLPNSGAPAAGSIFSFVSGNSNFFYNTAFGIEGSGLAVLMDLIVLIALLLIKKDQNKKLLVSEEN